MSRPNPLSRTDAPPARNEPLPYGEALAAAGLDGPLDLGPASVTVVRHGVGATILRVSGALDLSNGYAFARFVASHRIASRRVLIDFSGTDFIGTAALSALAEVDRRYGDGTRYSLVTSPALDHVITVCGWGAAAVCFRTVDDALARTANG